MTTEHTDPAAVVVSAEAARELTDRIRTNIETAWELIKQAYVIRAWTALGYESWDAYCATEFDGARIRIPREERSEVVASMREIGMSTRAIAAATGVSDHTVRQDLAGARNLAPHSDKPVLGKDGKVYPEPQARRSQPEREQGKARKVPRKPLPETFWTSAVNARKAIESLERQTRDDRFAKNARQIEAMNLGDLLRARDALQRVIDHLSVGE
ncbi:hypothetical protein VMT65_07525 [Nocardia sp. CDC153]|uniref:hypothetical protein n=1 Tax=Nocardia sp. CDC153 TaxID=3112167 RepID=UPI002DC00F16|nr:hypothetical protein [Nocardia sp. CDC153]MEC3952875.1 hypothetical protein [Nocardia sp. CDC153]